MKIRETQTVTALRKRHTAWKVKVCSSSHSGAYAQASHRTSQSKILQNDAVRMYQPKLISICISNVLPHLVMFWGFSHICDLFRFIWSYVSSCLVMNALPAREFQWSGAHRQIFWKRQNWIPVYHCNSYLCPYSQISICMYMYFLINKDSRTNQSQC